MHVPFFRVAPLLVCLAAVLLLACTPNANLPRIDEGKVDAEAEYQRELVLRDSIDKLDQLSRVSWNLLSKNAPLCGERVEYAAGFSLLELDDYQKEKRELLKKVLNLTFRPTVFEVAPGGPADKAGLKRGDIVVGVGEEKCETKKQVREALAKAIKDGRSVEIGFKRAGDFQVVSLAPERVCAYPVRLDYSNVVNAYATGDNIVVNYGMMKFVRGDDELAAIVGHEMAHNVRGHIRDKSTNSVIGAVLVDLPIAVLTGLRTRVGERMGVNAFSQQYEAEADYVGLYFSARAGYDIHHVADLWRRLALEDPDGISMGTTHPCTSKRVVEITADVSEIDGKRAANQPLQPEFRSR
jgi:hypothetical protein